MHLRVPLQAYGCQPREDKDQGLLRCMLLDDFFPSPLVCAVHLFKFAWWDQVQEVMGFQCINDVRNGLLLIKCVAAVALLHPLLPAPLETS